MKNKFVSLGPGILMAAAAIGVSHLVQSTRAGADYGYQFLLVIILANVFKYPFFEIGHRYYVATGETLLVGYRRLGKFYLYSFLVLNFIGAVGTVAAVTFVTSALIETLVDNVFSVPVWSSLLISISVLLLIVGRYKWLDRFIKVLMVVLLLTTVSAVCVLFFREPVVVPGFQPTSGYSWVALPFIIALMGWMPAPIELSVWQSLWMEAKERQDGRRITEKEARFDFHFGYFCTAILAVAFLILGARVMYGSGTNFSGKPFVFAAQIVNLYTAALGEWARPVISIAAFTAMFSTMITVMDSYPRSLAEGTALVLRKDLFPRRVWSGFWVLLISSLALFVITMFSSSLKGIVDLVTIISFLSAPYFAFLNLKLIRSNHIPYRFRQSRWLSALSYLGLFFLIVFGILFLYQRLVSPA